MITCVIFDFNRTLYLTELQRIPETALQLLKTLKAQRKKLVLWTIQEADRQRTIATIAPFFSLIKEVPAKSTEDLLDILSKLCLAKEHVIVVGDRINSEIAIANELSIKTVWYRAGKFRNETPQSEDEKPTFIIKHLDEILSILPHL